MTCLDCHAALVYAGTGRHPLRCRGCAIARKRIADRGFSAATFRRTKADPVAYEARKRRVNAQRRKA